MPKTCSFCQCVIEPYDVIVRDEDDSDEVEVYCSAECYMSDNHVSYYTYTGKGDDEDE